MPPLCWIMEFAPKHIRVTINTHVSNYMYGLKAMHILECRIAQNVVFTFRAAVTFLIATSTNVSKTEFTTFFNYHEMSISSILECNLFTCIIHVCFLQIFFTCFVTFSSGRLFRVATFELIVAHWGVWGDDLEHLYKHTCILWHGNGRRRLDGMMFASLTLFSQTSIYNITCILFYVAIGFVTC